MRNECFLVERGASGNSVMRKKRHLTFSVAGYRLFHFRTEEEEWRGGGAKGGNGEEV